jgi:hypothetical protein
MQHRSGLAIALCLLFASVVAAAVSSCNSAPTSPVQVCAINSDCNAPLICAFARCHQACSESRDCGGYRCVKSGSSGVCQLPQEGNCSGGACQSGQVCGPDQQCRAQCSTAVPCALRDYCLLNACYSLTNPQDEFALMDAGILGTDGAVIGDGSAGLGDAAGSDATIGSGDATVSDGAGNASLDGSSDAGARCANPPCTLGQPCHASTDCSANLQCIAAKCLQCVPGTTTCPGKAEVSCQNGVMVPSGSDCPSGCDPTTNRCRVCATSTCSSVKVIFHGWVGGADGGPQDAPLAVDTGVMAKRSASTSDPSIGQENVLVGNFITGADGGLQSPVLYATDNNACGLANYGSRTNTYYLAQMKGLSLDPSWYQPQCTCGGQCGGPPCGDSGPPTCDFENQLTSISCPNFGNTCLMTPRKIQSIETVATSGDLSCKICLYSGPTPSAATLLKCISPNTTLTSTDLYAPGDAGPAGYPVLLRLDDGSSCGSY